MFELHDAFKITSRYEIKREYSWFLKIESNLEVIVRLKKFFSFTMPSR